MNVILFSHSFHHFPFFCCVEIHIRLKKFCCVEIHISFLRNCFKTSFIVQRLYFLFQRRHFFSKVSKANRSQRQKTEKQRHVIQGGHSGWRTT